MKSIWLVFMSMVCALAVASGQTRGIKVSSNSFAAIAYSPATGKVGLAYNLRSRKSAEAAAIKDCAAEDARVVCWVNRGFCALALGDEKTQWAFGVDHGDRARSQTAMETALAKCRERTSGAYVAVAMSSDGQYFWKPTGNEGKIVTPQGEIDKRGNVTVPGQGGMKFAPNGDIFASDGTKLYDGEKKAWTPASGITGGPTDPPRSSTPNPPAIEFNPEPSAVLTPRRNPATDNVTAQATLDKDGNVVVPGLGGMKFAPNGDIFGGDGKKLYDGEKNAPVPDNKKSDTTSIPLIRLGETSAELTARLGKPEMRGSMSVFRQGDWTIGVDLHQDRADSVVWRKPMGAARNFTSEALFAMVKNPDSDMQELHRLHAGEKEWVKIGSDAAIVRRGQVVSRIGGFEPDAKALADKKLLYLPDVTWKSGSVRFNFEVTASDGALDKVLRMTTQDHEDRRRAKSPKVTEE